MAVRNAVKGKPPPILPLKGRGSYSTHAAGYAEGGQDSSQNSHYRLNDVFPSFFAFHFEFDFSFTYRLCALLIVSFDIGAPHSTNAIA